MIAAKKCKRCEAEKPLPDFYAHPKSADGHLHVCKTCHRADVRANRARKAEQYRRYEKNRYQQPERRAAVDQRSALHRQLNPEKAAARTAVGNALRSGRLKREPCERCGRERSEGHHEDYSQPLNVTWLCKKHHHERHAEIRAEREHLEAP